MKRNKSEKNVIKLLFVIPDHYFVVSAAIFTK